MPIEFHELLRPMVKIIQNWISAKEYMMELRERPCNMFHPQMWSGIKDLREASGQPSEWILVGEEVVYLHRRCCAAGDGA